MTRQEEIQKLIDEEMGIDNYGSCDFQVGVIYGVKHADKTMIEKACQWIIEHIDIPYEGEFIDDSPVASDYIEWCEKRLEYAKAIADTFKQAMEE